MTGPRANQPAPFDPGELGTDDPAEVAGALDSARRLAASIDDAPATLSAGFADRVMAALVDEPAPAAAGFLAPLQRRGLIVGFGASVRQAWASIGAPGRPKFARAAALAYILVIVIAGTSLAGAATITVAGALGILGPHDAQPTPSLPAEVTSPEPSEHPAIESESPGPEATEEASEGPAATDDHGGPEPSDDKGGGSSGSGGSGGSGGGGDDGSGGGGDHATPEPTGDDGSDDHGGTSTPGPSETPDPTSTSGTPDGSGGGSDDGSDPAPSGAPDMSSASG